LRSWLKKKKSPEFRYRVYKSPPPVPILSHLSPVQNLTPYSLMIHLNTIIPSTPNH